jgi:hypothetical protein
METFEEQATFLEVYKSRFGAQCICKINNTIASEIRKNGV